MKHLAEGHRLLVRDNPTQSYIRATLDALPDGVVEFALGAEASMAATLVTDGT